MGDVLCIDVGTTWLKLAVATPECAITEVLRLPSHVSELAGSADDVVQVDRLFREVETQVAELVECGAVDAIGLTGIREGLAVVDEHGRLRWASGNGDAVGSGSPPHGNGLVFLSLQGYLTYRLTGALCATHAERAALGIGSESEPLAPAAADARDRASSPAACAVGETVGTLHGVQGVEVFLAGTDEQAGYFGARIGERCDLFLSTGSFWSLACRATPAPMVCPALRQVHAAPPYPAYIALVGYRWGAYLAALAAGARLEALTDLPPWAAGAFVAAVRDGDVDLPAAAELIRRDLDAAAEVLRHQARRRRLRRVYVAGGGALELPALVAECLPPSWSCEVLQHDATLLGIARVAGLRTATRAAT